MRSLLMFFFFFFNDTATTEIYTLSLHDALPISHHRQRGKLLDRERHLAVHGRREHAGGSGQVHHQHLPVGAQLGGVDIDRKSTRLNSSHGYISYAVFCLKKKKKRTQTSKRHKHS